MTKEQLILFKNFFTKDAGEKLEEYCKYRKLVIQNQLCVCDPDQLKGLQGQLRELEHLKNFRDVLKREG